MKLAVIVADRYVFAWRKGVDAEAVAGFVIVRSVGIIVEYPSSELRAVRFVYEAADLLIPAVPKSADAAMIPKLLPQM
jgi:hypothetical protein